MPVAAPSKTAERAAGVSLKRLSALFALDSVRGFGPQNAGHLLEMVRLAEGRGEV